MIIDPENIQQLHLLADLPEPKEGKALVKGEDDKAYLQDIQSFPLLQNPDFVALQTTIANDISDATAGLALESYVDNEIAGATADLYAEVSNDINSATAGLALETYVDGEIATASANLYADVGNDISTATAGLALESYVDDEIASATADFVVSSAITSEINNAVDGLASESYVTTATAGLALESYVDSEVASASATLQANIETVDGEVSAAVLRLGADTGGSFINLESDEFNLNAVTGEAGGIEIDSSDRRISMFDIKDSQPEEVLRVSSYAPLPTINENDHIYTQSRNSVENITGGNPTQPFTGFDPEYPLILDYTHDSNSSITVAYNIDIEGLSVETEEWEIITNGGSGGKNNNQVVSGLAVNAIGYSQVRIGTRYSDERNYRIGIWSPRARQYIPKTTISRKGIFTRLSHNIISSLGTGGDGSTSSIPPPPQEVLWDDLSGLPSTPGEWAGETGFDGRYLRQSLNGSDIDSPSDFRDNLSVYSQNDIDDLIEPITTVDQGLLFWDYAEGRMDTDIGLTYDGSVLDVPGLLVNTSSGSLAVLPEGASSTKYDVTGSAIWDFKASYFKITRNDEDKLIITDSDISGTTNIKTVGNDNWIIANNDVIDVAFIGHSASGGGGFLRADDDAGNTNIIFRSYGESYIGGDLEIGPRLKASTSNHRWEVWDEQSTPEEKTAMGYLGGLPRNDGDGNWTTGHFGVWVRNGDRLVIDGDIEYEYGDWIVQHDASYRVVDGITEDDIIRIGTDPDTTRKGMFFYNTAGDIVMELNHDRADIAGWSIEPTYIQNLVSGTYVTMGTRNPTSSSGAVTDNTAPKGFSVYRTDGDVATSDGFKIARMGRITARDTYNDWSGDEWGMQILTGNSAPYKDVFRVDGDGLYINTPDFQLEDGNAFFSGEIEALAGSLGDLDIEGELTMQGGRINLPPSSFSGETGLIDNEGIRLAYNGTSAAQVLEWYLPAAQNPGRIRPISGGILEISSDFGVNIEGENGDINLNTLDDINLNADTNISGELVLDSHLKPKITTGTVNAGGTHQFNLDGNVLIVGATGSGGEIYRLLNWNGATPTYGQQVTIVNWSNYDIHLVDLSSAGTGGFRMQGGNTSSILFSWSQRSATYYMGNWYVGQDYGT